MTTKGMGFLTACLLTLLALPAGAVERVIHYHNDALGSPIAATDQDGRVVWRKSYGPYGQPIGPGAPNEPGYTGKLEEPDLGIQNFGARWYDPRIGRFLAIDPAGFDPQNPQSFNRYAYANNNPYRFVDPDGNSPLDVGFFIADTVSFGLAVASGNPAAIQSAAFDFAASAVGLASPIPGTGLAMKAARAADKISDAARAAKGAVSESRALSTVRLTQEGETFRRYESGNAAFSRVTPSAGVTPGTYAAPASDGLVPLAERSRNYNLPNPEIPRTSVSTLKPPAGTPIVGPKPVMGGTGNEVIFPSGF